MTIANPAANSPRLPLLRRSGFWALCLVSCLGGCSAESRLASNLPRSGGLWGITVRSSAFRPGKTIPAQYTADGGNISPPLQWTQGPAGTREFLLVMEDPNSPTDQPTVHWVVYHLPPSARSLPEGAASSGMLKQGVNRKGEVGYTGPAHHSGEPHHYYFEIFALSEVLDADPKTLPHDLFTEWEGFVLSKGQLVGTY